MSSLNVEAFMKTCSATNNLNSLSLCLNNDSSCKALIQIINKSISVASTRASGLEYLLTILPHLTQSVLSENAVQWISICVNPSQKNIINSSHSQVIGQIILACKNIQEFNKSIVSGHLMKIIEICLQPVQHEFLIKNNLNCLEICMRTYSSSCGQMKNKIEKYLLGLIDSECSINTLKLAGRCLHFLQQTGGAGAGNTNHIFNWSQQIKKLCKSLHLTYNKFFEDIPEFEEYSIPDIDACDFPQIPINSQSSLRVLAKRLENITAYLQAFIETSYPVQKNYSITTILDVIKRSLSVHQCLFNPGNLKTNSEFAILLLMHQKNILRLLGSFIASLKTNLIPFSFVITKLFLDLLKRTQTCKCFDANNEYHTTFHKVFRFWITTVKSNINKVYHEKLILALLEEIQPVKEDILLNLNTSITTQKSSKAKKKAINDQIASSVKKSLENEKNNKCFNICSESLQTLCCLFSNVVLSVQRKTLTQLYDVVFKTLQSVQLNKASSPYNNEICKAALYKLLHSIILQPPVEIALPIKACVNLFTKGCSLNQESTQIKNICFEALTYLEIICQPACPSLYLEKLINKQDNDNIETEDDLIVEEEGEDCEEEHMEDLCVSLEEPSSPEETVDLTNTPQICDDKKSDIDLSNNSEEEEELSDNAFSSSSNASSLSITKQHKSNKKEADVKILDVKIIKPGELQMQNGNKNSNNNNTNKNGKMNESLKRPAAPDQSSIFINETVLLNEDNVEDSIIEISDNEMEVVTPKKRKIKSEDTSNNITIDEENDDSEGMLDSFVDEVNE